ncbi:MAG: ABC transporter ATP-binding protein [Clostridia bacterium]|nr:ABC transporter ATP-binding protein [Clostridia bacterium]
MIILRSICKSFDGHDVLNNFNISFDDGSRSALMGPSGCGKTTLFKIISGLEKPDSGTLSGTESMRFSAVFQDDRLCENMSLYANMKLVCPKSTKKSEILNGIQELGLGGFENKPVSTLSGGMKRRASVLRAMLAEFDTLILDEPFNGLDRESKAVTSKYILDRLNSRTLIIITHNPEDAELLECKKITL